MKRILAALRRHIELTAIPPVLLALLAGAWAITGEHLVAFMRMFHSERMEALLDARMEALLDEQANPPRPTTDDPGTAPL